MTLSPEHSPVLRGADLDALPVATLIAAERSVPDGASVEVVDEVDDGPTTDELVGQAYQTGFDEGVAAAEAAIRSTLERTIASLEASANDLLEAKAAWEAIGPAQAVGVALEIAEMVMMREIATATDPGRDAIVRCLSEVGPDESAIVRLNPADLEQLGAFEDLLVERSFELVPDPSISSGDAVADTTTGSVDARLRGALGRVREELLR